MMPRSVITNGYSFVPCSDPRYFATRSRRVASSSWTRSSSTTTQSETYSSMPYLVSSPVRPRSPVMITVRPRSLSHRSSRLTSARTVDSLPSAVNNTSMVSSTTRFAPIESTALPSLMNRPSRSNPPAATRASLSIRNASTASSPSRSNCGRSNPSDDTFVANSSADSSKDSRTPGSPNFRAPQTRNSSPNRVLPDPAPPVTSVARPLGRPPRVISSNPPIPVGAFTNTAPPTFCAAAGSAPVASLIPDQPRFPSPDSPHHRSIRHHRARPLQGRPSLHPSCYARPVRRCAALVCGACRSTSWAPRVRNRPTQVP